MTNEECLASHGYKLVTRAEFDAANDVPAGIREVVTRFATRWPLDFVVYDPADDSIGWLLCGTDRDALARETVEFQCQPEPVTPEQPSLF